ncbi:hypothetical protein BJY27_000872 [Streptomyces rapamycinicus]|uniref:Uncharacterized protein n=2 Tax=Streptomyces rapamycinicus TaxID=1226757 RepID=A0A3L8R6R0_STRRN|nr:hypothetical protein [Streptomyces rapamycinicus]RLV75434.1 hypothetical protein D3C57_139450 [Streptomyces rapamycinicus NRRL 5491]
MRTGTRSDAVNAGADLIAGSDPLVSSLLAHTR